MKTNFFLEQVVANVRRFPNVNNNLLSNLSVLDELHRLRTSLFGHDQQSTKKSEENVRQTNQKIFYRILV